MLKKKWSPLAIVLMISGVFFIVFVAISAVLFTWSSPSSDWEEQEKTPLFATTGKNGVGILEIKGVIMDSKRVLKQLKSLETNKRVKALVVRINSPGGAVAPSQEIYEAIKKFPKPVVISMGSVAASGGYYIAVAGKKIFANPGTITGSIGVIMQFANLQRLYEWAKIEKYVVKTGKYKDSGSEARAMSPEEKALFQTMVDDVLHQFKTAIVEGRKISMEKLSAVADGRIMSGSQAKTLKLVDELGTIQDAVLAAAKAGGIESQPKWIYPRREPKRWIDLLAGINPEEDDESEMEEHSPITRWIERLIGLSAVERVFKQSWSGLTPGIYFLWAN